MPRKKAQSPLHKKYDQTQVEISHLIDTITELYQMECKERGLIAQWCLGDYREDLIKMYHRVGNLKHTIRKGKKKD